MEENCPTSADEEERRRMSVIVSLRWRDFVSAWRGRGEGEGGREKVGRKESQVELRDRLGERETERERRVGFRLSVGSGVSEES